MKADNNGKAGTVFAPERKNGKEPVKQLTAPVANEEQAPVIKLPEIDPKPDSVEERIFKNNQMNILIANREKIQLHQKRINALKIGELDEKDNITITSANNEVYTIKSSEQCKLVQEVLRNHLANKLAETDKQILA